MKSQTFRSFDDFAAVLKNEPVPYPDLESFSKKISTSKKKNPLFLRLKTIPLSILIVGIGILILSSATVSAFYAKFLIHNKDGEVKYEYSQTSIEQNEKDAKAREIHGKWENKINEIKSSLQTGEVAFFLIPELYELDKFFYPIQQDVQFTNIEQMKRVTTTSFIAPISMPANYTFLNGLISFEYEQIDLDKLYQEAKDSGKPYIVQMGMLTNKASQIFLTYAVGDSKFFNPEIHVHIRELIGGFGGTMTSAPIHDMEVIKLGNSELLYNPDPGLPSLTFVMEHNGSNLVYDLYGNSNTTKEELVQIATSLISLP